MTHIYTEAENIEWRKTLPRKIIYVKAIITNDKGEILLVKPNYRDHWHIPGGGVEAHESPLDGAIRELREETNITVEPNDMALMDILHRADTDEMNVVYLATVTADESDVRVQPEEIDEYRFVGPDTITNYISKNMSAWWRERGYDLMVEATKE